MMLSTNNILSIFIKFIFNTVLTDGNLKNIDFNIFNI